MKTLEDRVARLERSARRWRCAAMTMTSMLLVVVSLSAAKPQGVLQVEGLMLVKDGKELGGLTIGKGGAQLALCNLNGDAILVAGGSSEESSLTVSLPGSKATAGLYVNPSTGRVGTLDKDGKASVSQP